MYCPTCGAQNPDAARFCGTCGSQIGASAGAPQERAPGATRNVRAMSVGDILDETVRIYRQNFRTFIAIVAVLQIPVIALGLAQNAFVLGGTSVDLFSDDLRSGVFLLWFAWSLLTLAFSLAAATLQQASLAAAISQRYLGRPISVSGAYRVARSSFWRVLGFTFLASLIVGLLFITIIGAPVAIFIAVRLALSVQAIVLEGVGVGEGMSRSSRLVQGSWWRVAGVLLLGMIGQYLLALIPAAVLGGALGAGALLLSDDSGFMLFTIISSVIGGVFGILAAPLLPTITTLLYYDQRIRKEGFDMQLLVERPEQGDAPALQPGV